MPVKEIMQYGVTTVSPDESVNRVMNLMTHHRVRHMPVLRGRKLVGIVSIGDVVKHRLEDLELQTNVLRDVYNAGALTARASALACPNYEPEEMNNEEIERAAKLSVRKSAPLEYYCASACRI
jgi:CBS-domain-containing membrane protein